MPGNLQKECRKPDDSKQDNAPNRKVLELSLPLTYEQKSSSDELRNHHWENDERRATNMKLLILWEILRADVGIDRIVHNLHKPDQPGHEPCRDPLRK